jgi:hypothetical protein
MTVAGGFNVSGGGFSFTGRDLTIRQDAGSLEIPAFATIAANGGNVLLSATDGNMVNVNAPISSTDEIAIVAGVSGDLFRPNGGINLNAKLDANRVALVAYGFEGINQTTVPGTGITANELMVYTERGTANLSNDNAVRT